MDHIPGEANAGADGLSRQKPAIIALFAPQRRVHLTLHELLNLEPSARFYPPEAPWPRRLRPAVAGRSREADAGLPPGLPTTRKGEVGQAVLWGAEGVWARDLPIPGRVERGPP